MNTERSDRITKEFLAKNQPFRRKVVGFEKDFSAPPEAVFKQLCPSREADWINGWTVELVYTRTGYAEPLCVFRTPASNLIGEGIWIMTKIEPNQVVEAVVLTEGNDVLEHLKIDLVDLGDGRTHGKWTLTFTALSEQGNELIEMIPEDTPPFMEELEYFLTHGELKPLAA